jgi:hypothetical protein
MSFPVDVNVSQRMLLPLISSYCAAQEQLSTEIAKTVPFSPSVKCPRQFAAATWLGQSST